MRSSIFQNLVLFVGLFFLYSACYSQESSKTQFRLSGKHTFIQPKEVIWNLAQELIDEKTGSVQKNDSLAEAKGRHAQFELQKVKNKETIYHLIASGNDLSRIYKIRVFKPNRISSFYFKSKFNPAVRTFIFVPKNLNPDTRILIVMHGLSRTAHSYIKSWKNWARENNYVVVAPKFDNQNWKGSRMYNLGNMLDRYGTKKQREKWSFRVVEKLFEKIKNGFELKTDHFDIFGHSAGGQFVHRFMYFMPEARVRLAFAANSGWYTAPDLNIGYPYGLNHRAFAYTRDDLFRYSKRRIFILRGTADTERTSNLRQTVEADSQGKNRYDRAGYMYRKIKSINPKTNWSLIDAPGVGHAQKKMAITAQRVMNKIELQIKEGNKK